MISFASSARFIWSGVHRIFIGSDSRKRMTVVICPTAQLPARVGLDVVNGMRSCSRWPERQDGCSEACLPQIQFSAEELKDFTARQEGKKCSSCGNELTADDWYRSRLAAFSSGKGSEKLVGTQRYSFSEETAPVCSTCFDARISTGNGA